MKLLSQLVVPVLEKPPKFQPNSPEQFAVRLYCQFLSKAACLKKRRRENTKTFRSETG